MAAANRIPAAVNRTPAVEAEVVLADVANASSPKKRVWLMV